MQCVVEIVIICILQIQISFSQIFSVYIDMNADYFSMSYLRINSSVILKYHITHLFIFCKRMRKQKKHINYYYIFSLFLLQYFALFNYFHFHLSHSMAIAHCLSNFITNQTINVAEFVQKFQTTVGNM